MVTPLILPAFSLGMKEGTILKWFKKEKDSVEKGEVVVKVFGEKMEVDLDSPASGIMLRILFGEKAEVPVSTVIALIGEANEDVSGYLAQVAKAAPPAAASLSAPIGQQIAAAVTITTQSTTGALMQGAIHQYGRVKASPAARRIAREKNIDIRLLAGTGPAGRIISRDVLMPSQPRIPAVAARPELEAPAGVMDTRKVKQIISMSPTRRVIARRMSQSARTAPHITIIMETDMTEIVKLRERLMPEIEKRAGNKVSYTDIIVKAVAKVLEEFPILNSKLDDENTIRILDEINVGVAIATKEGLIVPVVRNANKLSIAGISTVLSQLIDKALKGKLTPEEMQGGTFTVTSLGMFGVDVFIPIINPPETGILAVGKITKKPAVDDKGQIVVKPMASLALAVDHRVIDGAPAAEILQRIKGILEDPFALRY
ncbi:MAG: dihydrolipoamide acetyltransferase family protein [Candidatus Atabeyarchaeum deiterrae]